MTNVTVVSWDLGLKSLCGCQVSPFCGGPGSEKGRGRGKVGSVKSLFNWLDFGDDEVE